MTALWLRETAPGYRAGGAARHFRECDLSVLWAEQRFPRSALVTLDGDSVRVIYRGRPGAGAGPDFRDAIVSFPGRLAEGDVELHVRSGDFYRHGHGADPAYDRVVLHVVLFSEGEPETRLACGRSVPVVTLGELLLHPQRQARKPFAEPCRDSVSRLGESAVGEALERLGRMRFRQKTSAWAKRLAAGEAPENALWSGLLEALGYGGEREAFGELAMRLPWAGLRASLMATAPAERNAIAQAALSGAATSRPGRIVAIRPGNSLESRLPGAAALAARLAEEGLGASLLGALDDADGPGPLLALLVVPRLIGRARAVEIAGNVVLPLAAALCGHPASLKYESLFASLPLPARYGAVRHLHGAASGVRVSAARQQGMLYLLGQYCTQGGCGRCPLS